ncbi:hypothetical protein FACS1894160_2370 [Bacteroidia bacterium]|nr:hypothetical protein FACS1894160_2370 [Bacteroidia bacterium]
MLLSLAAAGQVQESDNWRAEANARIEKHRKEDVSIRLTQNGKPVNGATVRVEMTRHEFFFGSNIFGWGANNTEYNRRFAELLNFATVGFYWAGYEAEKDKLAYDAMERFYTAFRGEYRITVTQGKKTRVFTEKAAKGKDVIEIKL